MVTTDLKATERPKNTASIRTYLTSVREVKFDILKGGGGILLNSYKVVEIFVHIIYGSTFGVYEKVLGISRPEKFFF